MRGRRRQALWRNPWLRVCVAVIGVAAVLLWIDHDESHAGLDPADAATAEVDFETYTPNERLGYEPVLVGDVLLSRVNRGDINDADVDLVASTDLGATWTTVALPERPSPVQELRIHDLDGSVAVAAQLPWPRRERNARVWLWLSTDGSTWTGGAVPVPRPGDKPASVGGVWRTADGAVVARVNTSDDIERAVRSEDGGKTWSETDCPRDVEPEPGTDCAKAHSEHGRLWVRPDGTVSLDDGATWQFPELPGISQEELAWLDVAEVPGDRWFAVATVPDDDGSDSWDERFLLRSDDGIEWELVFEADSRCWTGFPGEWISTPVPYGDQFVVAYTCDNPDDPLPGPLLSQLYLLDAAGTTLTAIADTHDDDDTYGQPTVAGSTILVARFEFTHGDISMLRLDRGA